VGRIPEAIDRKTKNSEPTNIEQSHGECRSSEMEFQIFISASVSSTVRPYGWPVYFNFAAPARLLPGIVFVGFHLRRLTG